MPEHSEFGKVPCDLVVNGMPVGSVSLRHRPNPPDDFDVVVIDPILGAFALHSGFEIDVPDPDSVWRRVSLAEFKSSLKQDALLAADDLPNSSEVAECRLFAGISDICIPNWKSSSRSVIGRQDAVVLYTQRIFYRVQIPYLTFGTTFLVPSASTARIPLQRAGFRKSEISPTALVEPRTGCAIQLVERDPRR